MNVEIGAEAALFPEKEYIKGIFVAVYWLTGEAETFPSNISKKGMSKPQSQFPHSCVCEPFIYFHDRSAYSAGGNMYSRLILGLYKSLIDT